MSVPERNSLHVNRRIVICLAASWYVSHSQGKEKVESEQYLWEYKDVFTFAFHPYVICCVQIYSKFLLVFALCLPNLLLGLQPFKYLIPIMIPKFRLPVVIFEILSPCLVFFLEGLGAVVRYKCDAQKSTEEGDSTTYPKNNTVAHVSRKCMLKRNEDLRTNRGAGFADGSGDTVESATDGYSGKMIIKGGERRKDGLCTETTSGKQEEGGRRMRK